MPGCRGSPPQTGIPKANTEWRIKLGECACVPVCLSKCEEPKWVNSPQKFLCRIPPGDQIVAGTHAPASVVLPAATQTSRHLLKITPILTLLVSVESNVLLRFRTERCRSKTAPPKPQECAGQALQRASFTQQITFWKSGGEVIPHFLPWLQAGNIRKSSSVAATQQCRLRGKQTVLLESLFKESDSRRAPPLSIPTNRESALSPTKTSQPRPFLHTRRKNAQGCSLLLPQRQLGMFGREAEMTGTTIRPPYLEKMA